MKRPALVPLGLAGGAFALLYALAVWMPAHRVSRAAWELAQLCPWGPLSLRAQLGQALFGAIVTWAMARLVAAAAPAAPRAAVWVSAASASALVLATSAVWTSAPREVLALLLGSQALVAWRGVAAAHGEVPARAALGAALALAGAALAAPSWGVVALPAAVLWWLRVGGQRRRVVGRRERRAALLLVPPLLLVGSVVGFGRALSLEAGLGALAAAAGALGPTAVAAALVGLAALCAAGPGLRGAEASAGDRGVAALSAALALGATGAPALSACAPVALLAGVAVARLGELVAGPPSSSPRDAALARTLALGGGLFAATAGVLVVLPAML